MAHGADLHAKTTVPIQLDPSILCTTKSLQSHIEFTLNRVTISDKMEFRVLMDQETNIIRTHYDVFYYAKDDPWVIFVNICMFMTSVKIFSLF